jgi:hypothetical protein
MIEQDLFDMNEKQKNGNSKAPEQESKYHHYQPPSTMLVGPRQLSGDMLR